MCVFPLIELTLRSIADTGRFWDDFSSESTSNGYSLMEGLLSVLYVVLITKEKYSGEIPVLCADV